MEWSGAVGLPENSNQDADQQMKKKNEFIAGKSLFFLLGVVTGMYFIPEKACHFLINWWFILLVTLRCTNWPDQNAWLSTWKNEQQTRKLGGDPKNKVRTNGALNFMSCFDSVDFCWFWLNSSWPCSWNELLLLFFFLYLCYSQYSWFLVLVSY